jgi:hypothetical protein
MGIGSFDINNASPPLAGDALQVGVFRYNSGAGQPFELLPNIRCLRIDHREGPEPPCARFEYLMDNNLGASFGWPSQFEQVWPIDAQGPYVVRPDDRLVVMVENPDGSPLYLFDGFAQVPQLDLTPQSQRVSFVAVGVAARAYDDVITGRVQRNAGAPDDTSGGSDTETDLPCRFNPADHSIAAQGGFRGNSTPNANFTVDGGNVAFEGGTGLGDFPVFIDPLLSEREVEDSEDEDPAEGAGDAGQLVAPWYISDALKYLISQPNPGDDFLSYPKFNALDDLLNAQYPPPGSDTFDPATAVKANVMIRDYDATNQTLPEAIGELLGYAGFVMVWMTAADGEGLPQTGLRIYRRDASNTIAPKLVYLDQAHNPVDPAKSNLTQLHLARDVNSVVNAWQVETAQKQIEVSIVLAPLYQPAVGDESAANRKQWFQSNLIGAPAAQRRMYRSYGADECGDGHWDVSNLWQTIAFDFAAAKIFPDDEDGSPTYTQRYRVGAHTLATRDTDGQPLRADLSISFDYAGDFPKVWDGSGTWQSIPHGWRLLPDRLGIEVTVEDPNQWNCGKGVSYGANFASAAPIVPGGDIRGVGWWANPPTGPPTNGRIPVLRLTTVIEDDLRMGITAPKRVASPTKFARWRAADARDHFQYASVHSSSIYYTQAGGDGTDPVVIRDDTEPAQTHAYQLRAAHEFPSLSGSLAIPYITTYYEIGDRIREITGRNASLQANVGTDQGEAPVYPWIVGVSWDFTGDRQQTILELTDRRAEPRHAW